MIKLRRLTVTGFRGARFSLPLDFTADHRSLSVFGDNASGKSTVTDALEWFIHNRVDHLWREDCKEAALRNVLLDPQEACEVTVEFSGSIANTKKLNTDLSVDIKNFSLEFLQLTAKLSQENIFLTHVQLHEFISKSKSEKRKAIASIIGYDTISEFRDAIQGALNALQRDRQYTSARQRMEEEKRNLLELAGKQLTSTEMLYEQMNDDLKKAGFDLKIADKISYTSVVKELSEKTKHQERIERKVLLDALVRDITKLRDRINELRSKSASATNFNDLVTEKSTISQIHLRHFLGSGAKVLEGGFASETKCPFCLSPYDLKRLRTEVEERLQAIVHIAAKLEVAANKVEDLVFTVSELKVACDRFRYEKLVRYKELYDAISSLSVKLPALNSAVKDCLTRYEPVVVPKEILAEIGTIDSLAEKHQAAAATESESLKLTEYESKVADLIARLGRLRETFHHYYKNSKIVALFERQILSLDAIFSKFVITQNTALQTVLDQISDDVGKFYHVLHPKENVDKVKLKIVGEEGVEFEYYFLGRPTHPPAKYLSESHLNSLGIVLFLASAKLFNRTSRFMVLDDIVTSFDVNHRRRLLRLLKENFSDWQIILLTHEAFWFDMIKKELVPDGWLIQQVVWDDENGIRIEPSPKDMKALIAAKRPKFDVSNDLRKLLEATLKEICFGLEVKMAFRYNDQNERRMSGELLSELRSTINRKCAELKSDQIFSDLEGSNLVATVGSHDNEEKIMGGDIDVALADIEKLTALFGCSSCGRSVEAKNVVPGKNKISCRCGGKELDWKG